MNSRHLHRIIAALVFLISLVQFLLTAQVSVSFWDPGELSAASYALQVPHPPGGPLFLLVGRIFYMLPILGNIGFRMNTLSVLASAFSVLFLYLVSVRLINHYKKRSPESLVDALGTYLSAAIGALALSFCDTFWFNGGESNYFAASSFLFTSITWLMMVWQEKADMPDNGRYLLLMAYLVGLSAGVHLMSVLAIVPVVMVVVFRKYAEDDEAFKKTAYLFLAHAVLILIVAAVMWSGQTSAQIPAPEETAAFDSRFKIAMVVLSALFVGAFWKKIFNRHSFYLPVVVGGIALFIAYPGIIKLLPDLLRVLAGDNTTTGLLFLIVIVAGLGYLALWLARKQKVIVHTAALAAILIIIGFTTYTMIVIRANKGTPMNENDPKSFSGLVTYLNREQYGDFPIFKRRWTQEPHQQGVYTNYSSDLDYLWRYQVDHMFNRFVEWNFIGRVSTDQDAGVDWKQLFGIPFFVGLLGLYFHFRKDWRMASIFLIMFVFMGYLIAFYQNQQQPQPRERDYFYPGAYFVFAVWISLGLRGLIDLVTETVSSPAAQKGAMAGIIVLGALFIPVRMFQTNYFTHDRSHNWLPWDYSYNLLQSCAPNAILFTNGDNDTFPLWYLQDVEGIRRDVRVACLSLVNTNWYVKQMKNQEPYGTPKVDISFSDATIDRLRPIRWEPRKLSLPVSPEVCRQFNVTDTTLLRTGELSFTMPNTGQYGDVKVIRIQDIVVREVVERNRWKRPIYFAVTCSDDSHIGLQDYLRLEGLAYRLTPVKKSADPNVESLDVPLLQKNLLEEKEGFSRTYEQGFKFRGLNNKNVFYDENELHLAQSYRSSFIKLALHYLYSEKDNAMCLKTLDRMEQVMPRHIIDMDYRLLFDLSSWYYAAGGKEQYTEIAKTLEQVALDKIKENPKDVSSYYNPYRILTEVYQKTGEYLKAADVLRQLESFYPGNPELKKEIDRLSGLATGKTDSAAVK